MLLEILYNILIFPIVQIIEFSFTFAQMLFKEAGISVLFISFVISFLSLPLYIVAENWQKIERDTVKKLKSKADSIKHVFKGDEQFMILSTYYRQNNYHPIYALRSSFSLLIQIPFFIAAFYYLSNLELLHNISFLFIKDLSAPDSLFSIGNISINILPVLMTIITCLSGFIYSKGLLLKDKIQIYIISFIFLILLYNSSSALVLYWTMNNIISLMKNIYLKIIYKYKHLILFSIFSLCFIFLAIFSYVNFGYNIKGQRLTQLSIFITIIPWLFLIIKKYTNNLLTVKYEKNKSLLVFIFSIFFIWCLFGLFIPSQLIVSSPQEFSFLDEYNSPLYFLFINSIKTFGMFFFFPICLYFLFSNKIKYYFSILFFAFSLGILINIFLFAGNYGTLSVDFIFSNGINYSNLFVIINLLILLIPIIISIFLNFQKNKNIIIIPLIISIISLTVISCINISNIKNSYYELNKYYSKEKYNNYSISPVFNISKNGNNILLIMLDRCISVFMPYIFEESPELKEIYTGFTYYPNTVSFNGFTLYSTPAAFGGYEYTPIEINKRNDIPLVTKHNEALLLLPSILSDRDFNIIVTDPPYANYNWIGDLSIYNDYPKVKPYITEGIYTDLWLNENNLNLPKISDVVKRNMFIYSVFRGLPLFFKQALYMEGNWFSPVPVHTLRLMLNSYAVLDYLPRLTNVVNDSSNNALMLVNKTTHKSIFMQAPDYIPIKNVTNYGTSRFAKEHAYHTTAAAIKRLADFFLFLKNEGIYDNTRIILFSDHGPEQNFINNIELNFNVEQFNAFLMVKDFNSSGEIITDNAFMSNADIPYLTLKNIEENPINPFTGNIISDNNKKEPFYINMWRSTHNTVGNNNQFGFNPNFDYFVHTNIFLKENWIKANEYK